MTATQLGSSAFQIDRLLSDPTAYPRGTGGAATERRWRDVPRSRTPPHAQTARGSSNSVRKARRRDGSRDWEPRLGLEAGRPTAANSVEERNRRHRAALASVSGGAGTVQRRAVRAAAAPRPHGFTDGWAGAFLAQDSAQAKTTAPHLATPRWSTQARRQHASHSTRMMHSEAAVRGQQIRSARGTTGVWRPTPPTRPFIDSTKPIPGKSVTVRSQIKELCQESNRTQFKAKEIADRFRSIDDALDPQDVLAHMGSWGLEFKDMPEVDRLQMSLARRRKVLGEKHADTQRAATLLAQYEDAVARGVTPPSARNRKGGSRGPRQAPNRLPAFVCSVCTQENAEGLRCCAVCETPRPAADDPDPEATAPAQRKLPTPPLTNLLPPAPAPAPRPAPVAGAPLLQGPLQRMLHRWLQEEQRLKSFTPSKLGVTATLPPPTPGAQVWGRPEAEQYDSAAVRAGNQWHRMHAAAAEAAAQMERRRAEEAQTGRRRERRREQQMADADRSTARLL